MPSLGGFSKYCVDALYDSKKILCFRTRLSHITQCLIKTMTTTSWVKGPRIDIQKFLLYSLIFFPFIFDPLSYPCPLKLSMSRPRFFNTFCKTSNNPCPVVSFTSKKPKKDSSMQTESEDVSTYLKIKDNCSWWLASGVQSRITEKYFDVFTLFIISDLIAAARRLIISFWIPWPR